MFGIPGNCKYYLKIAQDNVDSFNDPQNQQHKSFIFLPNKSAETLKWRLFSVPFLFVRWVTIHNSENREGFHNFYYVYHILKQRWSGDRFVLEDSVETSCSLTWMRRKVIINHFQSPTLFWGRQSIFLSKANQEEFFVKTLNLETTNMFVVYFYQVGIKEDCKFGNKKIL